MGGHTLVIESREVIPCHIARHVYRKTSGLLSLPGGYTFYRVRLPVLLPFPLPVLFLSGEGNSKPGYLDIFSPT